MHTERDPNVRAIVHELIDAAPPAPPLPDAGAARHPRNRRPVYALAIAAVVVIAALVARDGGKQSVEVINPPPDPLDGVVLPNHGLAVLSDVTYAAHSGPGDTRPEYSFRAELRDDAGNVLVDAGTGEGTTTLFNERWRVRLRITSDGVAYETAPRPDQTGAPAGCTIVGGGLALCGEVTEFQALADRIMIKDERGAWSELIGAPPGTEHDGDVVGHWAGAERSPDGRNVLAQWSGECEVPTAVIIPVDAPADLRAVTGEAGPDWHRGPNSAMYGWTADLRALVGLEHEPACGSGSDELNGVYAVNPTTGARTLLLATAPDQGVLRWTGVVDDR